MRHPRFTSPSSMCQFPWVVITKCHTLGGLNNRNLSSHISEPRSAKSRYHQGRAPSEILGDLSWPPPSSWGSLAVPDVLWLSRLRPEGGRGQAHAHSAAWARGTDTTHRSISLNVFFLLRSDPPTLPLLPSPTCLLFCGCRNVCWGCRGMNGKEVLCGSSRSVGQTLCYSPDTDSHLPPENCVMDHLRALVLKPRMPTHPSSICGGNMGFHSLCNMPWGLLPAQPFTSPPARPLVRVPWVAPQVNGS